MIDPMLQRLADKLTALIKESGLTAAEVARGVGVDRSAVSRWMSGERTPTLQNLIDLAKVLNADMDELWSGPTAIPATPEQRAMIEEMGGLDPAQQQALLALARTMKGGPT